MSCSLHTSDANFQNDVISSTKPVLVDFWAPWCNPCQQISPMLDELAQEMDGMINIVKLDIDQNPEVPSQYGVRSIPTLILFNKGEIVDIKVGGASKEALKIWVQSNI